VPAPRVSIYATDYDGAAEAVERAVAEHAPPLEGRTVLLKPNILGAMPPEKHVNTHPAIVQAAIEAVERRRPARVMVGDNSGMRAYGSNEKTAAVAGIRQVAGDRYVNLGASPVKTAVDSAFAERLAVSREVLECDVLVSLPKMKTHVATGITGAVKNTYGHLVGGEKTRLHREAQGPLAFARAVVDVYQIRPPDLVVMDAVTAMEGQGPSGGRPRQVGRILASTDAVALDTVMAAMMGLEPRTVPMLKEAEDRDLGSADLEEIEIDGPLEVVPDFKTPGVGQGFGTWISRIATYVFVTRPEVRYGECVKCGSCVQACPVEAIAMTEAGPVIDYGKCIRCFCCHEMCRYGAMDLSRRMRLLQGAWRR
jgi:uncharacterized protein (DUF362 family)/Pyruvate/2-oxoacid:ferredoxin oxidoreductase delta subunit